MAKTYRDIPQLTLQQIANFWNKVDKTPGYSPDGDCWIWTGAKQRGGYGAFNIKPQLFPAHRIAFVLHHGSINPALSVLHRCDYGYGGCVRPDHLWQGTQADNLRDMRNKGREAKGDRHGTKTHPEAIVKGEQVITAKLTEDQIREIRVRADNGASHGALAKEFGVSRPAISMIAERKRWKHVE